VPLTSSNNLATLLHPTGSTVHVSQPWSPFWMRGFVYPFLLAGSQAANRDSPRVTSFEQVLRLCVPLGGAQCHHKDRQVYFGCPEVKNEWD
jgi:hypothetical protein